MVEFAVADKAPGIVAGDTSTVAVVATADAGVVVATGLVVDGVAGSSPVGFDATAADDSVGGFRSLTP